MEDLRFGGKEVEKSFWTNINRFLVAKATQAFTAIPNSVSE